jgi:predicted transposase/invertase (TIGR01784 family)
MELTMLKASRFLNPKADIVFKKIFGNHANILKSFLNAMIPLPEGSVIEKIEYLPSEQVPVVPEFKRTIVDVKCTDQLSRTFIVEMQMDWTKDFAQRALYGASQAYTGQLKRGEDYKKLSPVYALALINENFDKSDEYYHHYTFRNEKNDAKIDGIELIFVELLKFQVTTATERRLQALWLRFLNEAETMVEIPEEYLGVEEFEEAFELSQESGFTRAELDHYNTYWDSVSSEKTLLEGKFDEGVERGREEGAHQNALQNARKMKEIGMTGEQIMLVTGLSLAELNALDDE